MYLLAWLPLAFPTRPFGMIPCDVNTVFASVLVFTTVHPYQESRIYVCLLWEIWWLLVLECKLFFLCTCAAYLQLSVKFTNFICPWSIDTFRTSVTCPLSYLAILGGFFLLNYKKPTHSNNESVNNGHWSIKQKCQYHGVGLCSWFFGGLFCHALMTVGFS